MGPGVVLPLKWRARFNGQVRAVFDIVAPQPGNSYRVVAGGRQEDLERVLARAADDGGGVFFDADESGFYNPQAYGGHSGGDWLVDESYSVQNLITTRRLVVWRKLHVEVDSMHVYLETLRDTHNDGDFWSWYGFFSHDHHERQTVVHEIGHQFELYVAGSHPPPGYSIMSIPHVDPRVIPPDEFAEDELLIIRETIWLQPPPRATAYCAACVA